MALDTSKMSKGKAEAMEIAEDSRQHAWEHPSFAGELFMGRLRSELPGGFSFTVTHQSPLFDPITSTFLWLPP